MIYFWVENHILFSSYTHWKIDNGDREDVENVAAR